MLQDNRGAVPVDPETFVIDMSCYADLGSDGTENMVVDAANNQITVNSGVREDDFDAELTKNNLIMRTVTAGGFFSLGGMVTVDVNGATVQDPIFSETVSSFRVMDATGTINTIDSSSAPQFGHSPLDYIRVSLGAFGVVTSMTVSVLSRPHANTLAPSRELFGPLLQANLKNSFITNMKRILSDNERVETFFDPYADNIVAKSFLALKWNLVEPATPIPNTNPNPDSACTLAGQGEFGAPFLPEPGESLAEIVALAAQAASSPVSARLLNFAASKNVESQVDKANAKYSDLWLGEAARVLFMSYFVELPDFSDAGMEKTWAGLDVVRNYVNQSGCFHTAAPMEFRFMKGGKSTLSGTYSSASDSYFVNLDLIGFAATENDSTPGLRYSDALLQFFAHVERTWVAMGGLPHNGKMYGFYDPDNPDIDSYSMPFNVSFMKSVLARRISIGAPVQAFKDYRAQQDPNNLFYSTYLQQVLS